jgi:hypothetical protein
MAVFDNGKVVHFGDSSMNQYHDKTNLKLYSKLDHNDLNRRKLYYARHGKTAEMYTAKWFSHKFLW